jgi:hypothetical protein
VAPSNTSSAPDISGTGASYASGVGSSGVGVSRGTAASRDESGGTMAKSPALTADDATRGTYEDVVGHAAG